MAQNKLCHIVTVENDKSEFFSGRFSSLLQADADDITCALTRKFEGVDTVIKCFNARHPGEASDAEEKEFERLMEVARGVVDEIEKMPIRSLAALKLKVKAAIWCEDDFLLTHHKTADGRILSQVLRTILYSIEVSQLHRPRCS